MKINGIISIFKLLMNIWFKVENIFLMKMLYVESVILNIENWKFLLLLNKSWSNKLIIKLVVMLKKILVVKLYLCVDWDI